MCIIKILIDKGVRDWPQYRRRTPPLLQTHACTQIHMMTGGAAEMKGLRRKKGANSFYWSGISAISDAPQQKSRGRLRDLQPAPLTPSCICVWLHFHYCPLYLWNSSATVHWFIVIHVVSFLNETQKMLSELYFSMQCSGDFYCQVKKKQHNNLFLMLCVRNRVNCKSLLINNQKWHL